METIYERPGDYDLEHEGDDEDIAFYLGLIEQWRPRRVVELASGSGRVSIPLARAAAASDMNVVGIERTGPMLEEARRRRQALPAPERRRLTFTEGDMRRWRLPEPVDLVLAPCSSLAHLLTIDDQVAAWRSAHDNLTPGGRFVVDLTMPSQAVFADSMHTPPRALVEIDVDTQDAKTGTRLLRYRTTRYLPHEQRAQIRFLYDRFSGPSVDRYVSDFDAHVYYPREVELLLRLTGFAVEHWYGDYARRPFRATSRKMITVAQAEERRPGPRRDR